MAELGELDSHHAAFKERKTRVVVVSLENVEDSKKTQADFRNLIVLADEGRGLTSVADVFHPHSSQDGGDTAAPATLLIDRHGVVQWEYRPERFVTRLSADELLAAVDKHLVGGK
jgi:peroxiredoxin